MQRAELLMEFATDVDIALLPDLLAKLPGLVEEEMLLPLQRVLFREFAGGDPQTAVSLAGSYPPGFTRDVLQLEVALEWADLDLPVAAAWLAKWEDGIVRDIAVKTMSVYLADTDEEKAREWIAALPESALKTELLEGACARSGGRAFDAVLAWAKSLPEGPQKERSLVHLSYQWERRDFQAAMAWVARTPLGADRDAAFNTGYARLIESRPDLAAQWASAIDDENLRRQKTEQAARAWLETDPTAARTWLATSNLPDSVKQNLLQTFSLGVRQKSSKR